MTSPMQRGIAWSPSARRRVGLLLQGAGAWWGLWLLAADRITLATLASSTLLWIVGLWMSPGAAAAVRAPMPPRFTAGVVALACLACVGTWLVDDKATRQVTVALAACAAVFFELGRAWPGRYSRPPAASAALHDGAAAPTTPHDR